mmetsp:Transcript_25204/g.24124  ORF Transcript_25204/g.24124 Transcript_25204/m.24124 type:complete len:105 (+) Transcript_25204:55-369(+)
MKEMINTLHRRMLCIYLLSISVAVIRCYHIDPETTPLTTTRRKDGAVLDLVMSDEATSASILISVQGKRVLPEPLTAPLPPASGTAIGSSSPKDGSLKSIFMKN